VKAIYGLTKVAMTNKVASLGEATPRAGAEPIIVGLRYKKDPRRGSHLLRSQSLKPE
jgi:hypothetical protein